METITIELTKKEAHLIQLALLEEKIRLQDRYESKYTLNHQKEEIMEKIEMADTIDEKIKRGFGYVK